MWWFAIHRCLKPNRTKLWIFKIILFPLKIIFKTATYKWSLVSLCMLKAICPLEWNKTSVIEKYQMVFFNASQLVLVGVTVKTGPVLLGRWKGFVCPWCKRPFNARIKTGLGFTLARTKKLLCVKKKSRIRETKHL